MRPAARTAPPASAPASAIVSALLGARRKATMPQIIRITLPELPNSVALPSFVNSIPACQLARSSAKKAPAARRIHIARGEIIEQRCEIRRRRGREQLARCGLAVSSLICPVDLEAPPELLHERLEAGRLLGASLFDDCAEPSDISLPH